MRVRPRVFGGLAASREWSRFLPSPPPRGLNGTPNMDHRGFVWVRCPWGGGEEESLRHDAEPGSPKGVTPPTTVSKLVRAGGHHGAGAGAPYRGAASPPPPPPGDIPQTSGPQSCNLFTEGRAGPSAVVPSLWAPIPTHVPPWLSSFYLCPLMSMCAWRQVFSAAVPPTSPPLPAQSKTSAVPTILG